MYAAAGSTDDSRLMTGWRISSAAPSPTGEVAALEREIRQATGGVGQGRLWEGGRCRCSQFECLPHPPLGQGRSRCPMVGSPVAAQISHAGARPRRAHRWLALARRRRLASLLCPPTVLHALVRIALRPRLRAPTPGAIWPAPAHRLDYRGLDCRGRPLSPVGFSPTTSALPHPHLRRHLADGRGGGEPAIGERGGGGMGHDATLEASGARF
jgi:hypothetical protein